jgi:hypothetical protein
LALLTLGREELEPVISICEEGDVAVGNAELLHDVPLPRLASSLLASHECAQPNAREHVVMQGPACIPMPMCERALIQGSARMRTRGRADMDDRWSVLCHTSRVAVFTECHTGRENESFSRIIKNREWAPITRMRQASASACLQQTSNTQATRKRQPCK